MKKFSSTTTILAAVALSSTSVVYGDDFFNPLVTEPPTEKLVAEPLMAEPNTLWTAQLFPDANLGSVEVQSGNGVFLAPDGAHALVTTVGATVYAFNAYTGEQRWVYQPEQIGTSIARSHSAVTFSPTGEYAVYAVVDNENSLDPTSRVIAFDMNGKEMWISDDLDGVASGSPQVSSDGLFVYLTHNSDEGSNGHFTILDANYTSMDAGTIFYSDSSGDLGEDPTNAYAPLGIFHSPTEGNYDPLVSGARVSEGEFNTNDMIMWSQTPKPSDEKLENGFLFGFQFPRDFIGNVSDISYFQMGNFERDFQSLTAPVMTNNGLSAYWGVTRSGFRGWTPKRFSRARSASIGFTRNDDFPGQPVWAQPAVSNDGPTPFIFSGSAAKEFVKMNFDFTEQVIVPTLGYVKTKALVDVEERAVYYVESNTGILHQANVVDLTDLWTIPVNFSVEGEMALTPRSDVLIVADTRGVVTALQLAEIPTTESPTSFPTDGPTVTPTMAPTNTSSPVESTASPTAIPTLSPIPEPTVAPVAPVAAPIDPSPVASSPVVPEDAAPTAMEEEPPAGTPDEESGMAPESGSSSYSNFFDSARRRSTIAAGLFTVVAAAATTAWM